jgi:hypothetical protein
MSYFKNFPDTQYTFPDGSVVTIKDIFKKAKIEQKALNGIIEYTYYEVQEGERPDVVASKLYGDGDLHWVFYLTNDFDNYYSWYKSSQNLTKYLEEKYTGYILRGSATSDILQAASPNVDALNQPIAATKFLLGEKVTSISAEGTVIEVRAQDKEIVVELSSSNVFLTTEAVTGAISGKSFTPSSVIEHVNGISYYKDANGNRKNTSGSGYTAVTHYEEELDKNEELRKIKVVKPSLISRVVSEFGRIIR